MASQWSHRRVKANSRKHRRRPRQSSFTKASSTCKINSWWAKKGDIYWSALMDRDISIPLSITTQQPPPNMQFNQTRAQMMIPPPSIQLQQQQQQQDINSFQSGGHNFIQQVNVNRFSAPTARAMMNSGGNNDSGNVIAGSGNYQQPPRFQRQQWQWGKRLHNKWNAPRYIYCHDTRAIWQCHAEINKKKLNVFNE